jgi:phage tail-like protein
MADLTSDPAVAMCFSVTVDGHELGLFSACDGLGCEVVLEPREEGGNNDFVHQLPVRIRYPNVKLTRAINKDSAALVRWLATMSGALERTNARISAMRLDGTTVVTWSLRDVIPVRWQGPSLNVDTAKGATETLELAHHGFEVR